MTQSGSTPSLSPLSIVTCSSALTLKVLTGGVDSAADCTLHGKSSDKSDGSAPSGGVVKAEILLLENSDAGSIPERYM